MPVRELRDNEKIVSPQRIGTGARIRELRTNELVRTPETPEESVNRQLDVLRPEGPSRLEQMTRGGVSALSMVPALALGGGAPATFGRLMLRTAAESIPPMVAETAMQQTGLAPESGADIAAAGLLPLAVRGGLALPGLARGGARGVGGFGFPQQLRNVGVEEVQRALRPKISSKTAFMIARRQGPVPTGRIVRALDNTIKAEARTATPSQGAIKALGNLKKKLIGTFDSEAPTGLVNAAGRPISKVVPGKPVVSVGYDDLIEEAQRLRAQADDAFRAGNSNTGKRLGEARKAIIDAMGDISPAIKTANAVFRREESIKSLAREMRKNNAGNAVRNMFERDPLVADIFSKAEKTQIVDIADRISRIGTGVTLGAGNRILGMTFELMAEAVQEPAGRAILTKLIQNPRNPVLVNRWRAILVSQFGRGAFGRIADEESPTPQDIQ